LIITQKTNVWQGIRFSPSRLARDRGVRIAAKRAVVAVVRKLAVIMHRMWLDGSEFRFAASDGREDSAGASQMTALAAPY
jgi:transposase